MFDQQTKYYFDNIENIDAFFDSIDNPMEEFIDLLFNNLDLSKLLIKSSEGSSYSGYTHMLIEKETETNIKYLENLKKIYNSNYEINEEFIHIISSISFTSVKEIILHDMDILQAKNVLNKVSNFFISGWRNIFKEIKNN